MRSQQSGVHVSRRALVLVTAVLLVGVRAASAATTETFVPTTIHYPGSTSTAARGINNSGEVVGTYSCAVACVNPLTGETSTAGTHGFLLQEGAYTRIDVPGGTNTTARGISEQGAVVGHYNVGAVTPGFGYAAGTYIYPTDGPAARFENPASPRRDTPPTRSSP